MLVLTRKEKESLFIGNDIEICVTHLGRSKVRLGIKAPKELGVKRWNPARDGDQATQEANEGTRKKSKKD